MPPAVVVSGFPVSEGGRADADLGAKGAYGGNAVCNEDEHFDSWSHVHCNGTLSGF